MRDLELSPDPNLMDSMRAVGYTTETAIADIVDNSVSALASTVDVFFAAAPDPYIAVLDDGQGMDADGLIEAMRLAGRSPSLERRKNDLGRFGLGLKTASLSQCRCLTVISKRAGELHGVRWDLNHLLYTGTWALQVLEPAELAAIPELPRLLSRTRGTLVVWTDLDRIAERGEDIEASLDERMARSREHLSLVFHRFTAEAIPPLSEPLTLSVNGSPVPPVDPFLRRHRGTHEGPTELFQVRDAEIRVTPFTLPHLNKLTNTDRKTALISGTLRDTQGFYIYRAHRLVQWGTWFRLTPKNDLSKLARVQVDVPNTLDDLWSLDIKKSAAVPPAEVRHLLRRLTGQLIKPSQRTQRFRGRPHAGEPVQRLWLLLEDRGSFRYEINRQHPLMADLIERLPMGTRASFTELMTALESTFPVEDAHNRLAEDVRHSPPLVDTAHLTRLARGLYSTMDCSVETLAERLSLVEPFTQVPELEAFLRGALIHDGH